MSLQTLRSGAGVAFKAPHFEALMADPDRVDFIEIHAENYFGEGGLMHAQLAALRARLPVSLHGVGLSLGGTDALDAHHLQRLVRLCDRYAPAQVSEHLAWTMHDGRYLGDLLPLPYHEGTLASVAERVDQVQQALGRQILIENPSTYLRLAESRIRETEFLGRLCERTGCGILLDINNVIVSSYNLGTDPLDYLQQIAPDQVGEIHLAGHTRVTRDGNTLLIDEHASAVDEVTWQLYVAWLERAGAAPCVIEWDRQVPGWSTLAAEVDCARALQCHPYMPMAPQGRLCP